MELPEGKSGQQAHLVEKLQKRAELMGAQKTGNWFVNCETYQAVATFSKCFYVNLHHCSLCRKLSCTKSFSAFWLQVNWSESKNLTKQGVAG